MISPTKAQVASQLEAMKMEIKQYIHDQITRRCMVLRPDRPDLQVLRIPR